MGACGTQEFGGGAGELYLRNLIGKVDGNGKKETDWLEKNAQEASYAFAALI